MAIDFLTLASREYRDININFEKNPVTDDVLAVTGADAVKKSVRSILMTQAGEVPFLPNFGSRLTRLLFEPMDGITTSMLDSEIRTSITTFEPRVTIRDLTITPTPDEHQYQVDLVLQLVNLPTPITLTIFLTRIR